MNGSELIAAERHRQVEDEGWTPEHDDAHDQFELTKAAMCYARQAELMGLCVWQDRTPNGWPETWSKKWWKPEPKPIKSQSPMIERMDAIRMLVKAGGLIAAEIDRLLRSEVTITADNYPSIFKAFTSIDYANGAVNRLEPKRGSYQVPIYCARNLSDCESGLSSLTKEELGLFCDGEHDEVLAFVAARPSLTPAHALLNAYFSGWEIDGGF